MKIGIDIGGTFIKAGVVDKGKIIRSVSVPTQASKGKKQVVKNFLFVAQELFNSNKVSGIGIGCAGFVNHEKGYVTHPYVPITKVKFPQIVKKRFKLPAKIDNDANCFALAEFKYGAGKGSRNMIGITMGTGIGSGIIINGQLYHGRDMAGELGHTIIVYNGEICNCGKRGHVEAYLGTKAIQKRFGRALTPKEIFELAEKGDRKAIKTWQDTGKYLGIFVTNIIHTFDPDVIVIGGNVAKAWRFFSKSMYATIEKEKLRSFERAKIKVVKSKLEDAGVIGAAELIDAK